jgi:hypothetical protein
MRWEGGVACFKLLCQHLPERTEKNCGKPVTVTALRTENRTGDFKNTKLAKLLPYYHNCQYYKTVKQRYYQIFANDRDHEPIPPTYSHNLLPKTNLSALFLSPKKLN